MRIALVVPGGVDRSGEMRVIPALLSLIERLATVHDLQVFCLYQEEFPACWTLRGAGVCNIGIRHTRRRAVQAIYTSHRRAPFDLIHAIWSGTCGLIARMAAILTNRPCLIHVAGGELAAVSDIGYGGMLTWRGRRREAWVFRGAAAVTAASRPVIEALAAFKVAARRVPLGVDLATWPVRSPSRRTPGAAARLIHVASLNRVKDQNMLLDALALLSATSEPFVLDIIGEDTLGGEIQATSIRLGLGARVRFRGFLMHRELRPFIDAADLLVMTSRHETGPLVVLEAAIAGVPTVGTAVGHIAEWAPAAAVAVPPGDARLLAGAISAVLCDESYRLRLATAAQHRAMLEDADHTARSFLALYAALAAASPVTTVSVCKKWKSSRFNTKRS